MEVPEWNRHRSGTGPTTRCKYGNSLQRHCNICVFQIWKTSKSHFSKSLRKRETCFIFSVLENDLVNAFFFFPFSSFPGISLVNTFPVFCFPVFQFSEKLENISVSKQALSILYVRWVGHGSLPNSGSIILIQWTR
ncbi:unnamed protein product [Cuscuta epithymum]|uniref:Uncharacterized protein n=1 Tax=Cuscuta epithymum TaxID=186058 RepID=A0AAV0C7J3_9ASTE|nr:unnamed protein product [Cuscuta epithymum]